MRYHTTSHVQNIRERRDSSFVRRVLNVKYFTDILEYDLRDILGGQSSAKSGKKRAAQYHEPFQDQHPRKRFKRLEQDTSRDTDKTAEQDVPSVAVPVYQHSFELRYTHSVKDRRRRTLVNDEDAAGLGWVQQENALCALIEKVVVSHSESAGPYTLDLGDAQLVLEGKQVSVLHEDWPFTTFRSPIPESSEGNK